MASGETLTVAELVIVPAIAWQRTRATVYDPIQEPALHRVVVLVPTDDVGGPEAGEGNARMRSHPSFRACRHGGWPASVGLFLG